MRNTLRAVLHRFTADRQGYTLVVIAALFAAFAVMASAMLDRDVAVQTIKRQADTQARLRRIATAINTYTAYHSGRLPCPASPYVSATGGNFGQEVTGCYTTSTGLDVLSNSELIRGMVPVRSLIPHGLDISDAFDAWNGRIMYVVNRRLTDGSTTYPTVSPSVTEYTVNTSMSNNGLTPEYLLISYGRDHMGAIQRGQNSITIACPSASTILREENCDFDTTFYVRPVNMGSTTTNTNYFDDMVLVPPLNIRNCLAQTVTWGSGVCTGNLPAIANNGNTTILNTAAGHSGQITYVCTNGTLTPAAASCI